MLEREDRGLDTAAASAAEHSAPSALRNRCTVRACRLRHARLVDANRRADLFHRGLGVVIHADHLLRLPRRQRRDRGADAVAHLPAAPRTPCPATAVPRARARAAARRDRRSRPPRWRYVEFDRVDPDHRAAEPRLVGTDARREIGERRLGTELAAQRSCSRAPLRARGADGERDAARRRGEARRSSRRARAVRQTFRTHASRFVEAAGGVNEPQHAVRTRSPSSIEWGIDEATRGPAIDKG